MSKGPFPIFFFKTVGLIKAINYLLYIDFTYGINLYTNSLIKFTNFFKMEYGLK